MSKTQPPKNVSKLIAKTPEYLRQMERRSRNVKPSSSFIKFLNNYFTRTPENRSCMRSHMMTLKIKPSNSHFENLHTNFKKWRVCGVWTTTHSDLTDYNDDRVRQKKKRYLPPREDSLSISFYYVTLIQTSKA